MGRFSQGLLMGIGIGILVAPQTGAETRRLLADRIQKLRHALPENAEIKQSTRALSQQAQQSLGAVKEGFEQASQQSKDKVQEVGRTAAQTFAAAKTSGQQSIDTVTENVSQNAQQAGPAPSAAARGAHPATDPAASASVPPVGDAPSQGDALRTIPGMDPEPRSRLESQGIRTTQQLLERTATKEKRSELAQRVGISTQVLKGFIERADLMRIEGIGYDEVSLLEAAGVNGCKDLQHRNSEHLHATLVDLQEKNKSAVATISLDEVTQWIADAMAVTSGARR